MLLTNIFFGLSLAIGFKDLSGTPAFVWEVFAFLDCFYFLWQLCGYFFFYDFGTCGIVEDLTKIGSFTTRKNFEATKVGPYSHGSFSFLHSIVCLRLPQYAEHCS